MFDFLCSVHFVVIMSVEHKTEAVITRKKILSQISLNLLNTCNLEKLLLPENLNMKRKLRVQEHSGIFGTPFSGFVPVYCINTKKKKRLVRHMLN